MTVCACKNAVSIQRVDSDEAVIILKGRRPPLACSAHIILLLVPAWDRVNGLVSFLACLGFAMTDTTRFGTQMHTRG